MNSGLVLVHLEPMAPGRTEQCECIWGQGEGSSGRSSQDTLQICYLSVRLVYLYVESSKSIPFLNKDSGAALQSFLREQDLSLHTD